MTKSRSNLWRMLGAIALAWVALVYPACVGTPLPDPPSFSELVSWSVTPQTGTLRLVGRAGAVDPAGSTLRITDPPTAGELVATNGDGSFGRIVPGMPGDVIYVERVTATDDVFVGAFTTSPGGTLTVASPGADTDGDGTPDAIDCAPMDATRVGQRCAAACRADSDCPSGQACVAGACAESARCTAEVCNGIDDDCNSLVDDGDPNGGVACVTSARCPGTFSCASGCVELPHTDHETCGNGIDDDCNGLVDEGC